MGHVRACADSHAVRSPARIRVQRVPNLISFGNVESVFALRYRVASDKPLIAAAVDIFSSASATCAACSGWIPVFLYFGALLVTPPLDASTCFPLRERPSHGAMLGTADKCASQVWLEPAHSLAATPRKLAPTRWHAGVRLTSWPLFSRKLG